MTGDLRHRMAKKIPTRRRYCDCDEVEPESNYPVCASNGALYTNACLFQCAKVRKPGKLITKLFWLWLIKPILQTTNVHSFFYWIFIFLCDLIYDRARRSGHGILWIRDIQRIQAKWVSPALLNDCNSRTQQHWQRALCWIYHHDRRTLLRAAWSHRHNIIVTTISCNNHNFTIKLK